MDDLATRIAKMSPAKQRLAIAELQARLEALEHETSEPIAIIGIGCRFPGGAHGPQSFWRLLHDGVDAITEVPAERWDWRAFDDPGPMTLGRVNTRWAGFVEGVDAFDAHLFGFSPREAERIDPQQRMLLETTWEAIEDAGIDPERLRGSATGVFIGYSTNDYGRMQLTDPYGIDAFVGTGVPASMAGCRLSYWFDFKGPSLVVDTACSSSLVAVHLACQSLRRSESSLALAGGVNAILRPEHHIMFSRAGLLAPDGRCKAFDARADGFSRAEGAGMVVLKRLKRALEDNDAIYAVIRGTAMNHDGRTNGITAPSRLAQEIVIRDACRNAGIAPIDLHYVEAHGTGTALGDAIELKALDAVVGRGRERARACIVGSVKSNIGHAEAAAGVAGLIKTTLTLQRRQIPPSLHFERPNPHADYESLRLRVANGRMDWPVADTPARAGVSSFSVGGTNAHVVLEEATAPACSGPARAWKLVTMSAKTPAALDSVGQHLSAYLHDRAGTVSLADVCYTLHVGRSALPHRAAVVCRDIEDARDAIAAGPSERCSTGHAEEPIERLVFMFPGLGDHYPGMAAGLYASEPVFRTHFDRCSGLLQPLLGMDLRAIVAASVPRVAPDRDRLDLRRMVGRERAADATGPLDETWIAQPAVFAVEYALAQLLMHWGLRPDAVIGHSLGEYVAACVAGVFSLEDALLVVARRARLIHELPRGAMLAVTLPEEQLSEYLTADVSICAVNAPTICVAGGSADAIARLSGRLARAAVACRPLPTTHAFHSHMLSPAASALASLVAGCRRNAPVMPLLSNLTGTWMTAEQAVDPQYWARHMCETVRFLSGIGGLLHGPKTALVEVGAGQGLTSFARLCGSTGNGSGPVSTPTLPAAYEYEEDLAFLLRSIGKLWIAGATIDWQAFYAHEQRTRLRLPTYPFERRRYWLDPTADSMPPRPAEAGPDGKPDIDRWFSIPVWSCRSLPESTEQARPQTWIVLGRGDALDSALVSSLRAAGHTVTSVVRGSAFQRVDAETVTLDPHNRNDYLQLFSARGPCPDHVLHLWTADDEPSRSLDADAGTAFYSLLFLVQALGERFPLDEVSITVVSRGLHSITGTEPISPANALTLGPCRVVPLEYARYACRSVEIDPAVDAASTARAVLREALSGSRDCVVAYRGGDRYVQRFEAAKLAAPEPADLPFRERGVYLITGGFGGVGLGLASLLARRHRAKIVLIGRTPLPPREEWASLLAERPAGDEMARRIRGILGIEESGGEVLCVAADVADREQMELAVRRSVERFGCINGVFHAAGVPGAGLIQLKTAEAAAAVFAPKVNGTVVLRDVLAGRPLDFVLLFSSVIAVTGGGPGQVDYCAANAFLDAFAAAERLRGVNVSSIDWGFWQWDAWQDKLLNVSEEIRRYFADTRRTYGLTFDEGYDALTRVLGAGKTHVVVSPQDLRAVVDDSLRFSAARLLEAPQRTRRVASAQARPPLCTPYVEPRNELERAIVEEWQELLGITCIGVDDNFFELGGNSLLAISVAARLRERLGRDLPLRVFSQARTVAALAAAFASMEATEQARSDTPGIAPDPERRYEPFPLTDVQYAYWIGRSGGLELGGVATHSYIEIDTLDLDLERLSAAWRRLIDRHDMLRAIVRPDGQQQVLEHVPPYEIRVNDLSGRPSDGVERDLTAVRDAMSHQVLPAGEWPLFNLAATRLDARRVRLHLGYDFLIGDAWSSNLLSTELWQLYENPQVELTPLPISFRDYVLAEAALAATPAFAKASTYWQKRAAGLPGPPDLPLARDPGAVSRPRFVRRTGTLDAAAWGRVKALGAAAGITPSVVLATAYADVLARWSRSPRFTLNLTLFNRQPLHPAVPSLVGDFTSLTMLEIDNGEVPTFVERARRIQERLWDDLDHRLFSGVRVLRELARTQSAPRKAFMPVVFTSTLAQNQRNGPTSSIAKFGQVGYGISQTPQVWLDHQVFEEDGCLAFNWDAVEELFPDGLLEDMFDAYTGVLRRLDDEDTWHARGVAVTSSRQVALCELANATGAPIPAGLLHEPFFSRAAESPDAVAVITRDTTLTYGELACGANRLARCLREMGGGKPDTLIAVVMEKGWEQVLAVLGILSAGAAYLPLSADLPHDRLLFLLENGLVDVALTQPWLDATLPWPPSVRRLCIDRDVCAGYPDTPLEPIQQPGDLAYVIFTSGSTGQPKGVMIDHRGALNTVVDINSRFAVGCRDRVLALSSLSFDLSVYDIFGTLAAGAALVIPPASSMRDPAEWSALIARHSVSVWNSVPALMQMLVDYAEGVGTPLPAALRLVMLSGDWIPVTLPDRIRALNGEAQIVGLGGATEASIWSILYPIGRVDPDWRSVPYGKPMLNQSWHVLDSQMDACPVWVPGSLYIGGIGLARGYWRDTEKTNARFVMHPRTGERLYRTGDLGRYLPDGNIEFLGRDDFQVKIQGYRIELGEIETALASHPSVQAVAVATADDVGGGKRLVAYVVPAADRNPGVAAAPKPDAAAGIILDPMERLRFKLARPALRTELSTRRIQLSPARVEQIEIDQYITRRSYRQFRRPSVSLAELGQVFNCLRSVRLEGYPLPKYCYASAGGLYPVQTYLYIKPGGVEGVAGGTYYYDPEQHALVSLDESARIAGSAFDLLNRDIFERASFGIFLIAKLSSIAPMYGDLSADFCRLEAGIIAHALESAAPACHIGLCQIGNFAFHRVRSLFLLDDHHLYLHCLLGGGVAPEQVSVQGLIEDAGDVIDKLTAMQAEQDGDDVPADALIEDLREHARTRLPHYMVPSAFVLLDRLPLTGNGKVDRAALPGLEKSSAHAEARVVAPRTDTESRISAIWQDVLGSSILSVDRDFFAAGGDSLSAVKLLTRLQAEFRIEIPIQQLFDLTTIERQAEWMDRVDWIRRGTGSDEPAEAMAGATFEGEV